VEYDVHVSNVNDKNTSSEKDEISSFHENGMKTPIENLFYSTHICTIKSLKNRQPSSEKKTTNVFIKFIGKPSDPFGHRGC
jgi:hypothetical protein